MRCVLVCAVAARLFQPMLRGPGNGGPLTREPPASAAQFARLRASGSEFFRDSRRSIAGAAAVTYSMLPSAAVAGEYYMSADDEKAQTILLAIIGGIVLVSPIIGIQMARGAISAMSDDEMKASLRDGKDPSWSVTPDAKRKAKNRALQAQLDAEASKKKGWFGR